MMIRRLVPLLAPLLASAATLIPSEGQAGYTYTSTPYCATFSAGGGYCAGTMLAMRNGANNSYAEFQYSSTSGGAFMARSPAGNYGYCVATSAYPAVVNMWPMTMGYTGYFEVYWNASGVCTSVLLYNGSGYSTY